MTEFLRQGGYAFFVWGAYGVTFALLLAEAVSLVVGERTIRARIGRWVLSRAESDSQAPPESLTQLH